VLLDVDHRVPVAAGGSNDPSNLVAACKACNGGKSDRLLVEGEFPVPSTESIEERKERLQQGKAYAALVAEERAHDDAQVQTVKVTWAKAFGAEEFQKDGNTFWRLQPGDSFPNDGSIRQHLKKLPLEEMLEAVDITASRMPTGVRDAELYFFAICRNKARALEEAPPAYASRTVPAIESDPRESGVFQTVELEPEWTACSPCLDVNGEPDNYPEWETWGDTEPRWLEAPVRHQDWRAWSDANDRRKGDPDAGDPPEPFLPGPSPELPIRNPQWVRYWRKYGYSQERERIRDEWGPDGFGNYQCVWPTRIEETMSDAQRQQVRDAFISELRANARAPWTPLRVTSIQFILLVYSLSSDDIFLDEATVPIGLRVAINDKVIASIEAVCEDGYDAVAYYVNVEEWTPPGISIADYHSSKRRAG
jgi:hypothetical protein